VMSGTGYRVYSKHEAYNTGRWLSTNGFLGFVLRHRFGPDHPYPQPLADAQKAIRIIRYKSKEWGIDKIIVWGQNSGGHMASVLSTHFDYQFVDNKIVDHYIVPTSVSAKPDGQVLIFPFMSLRNGSNDFSKKSLLGEQEKNETLVEFLSSELHVNEDTPPCFIIHTINRESKIQAEPNSDIYVNNLLNSGVAVTYYKEDFGIHSTILIYPGSMASNFLEWISSII